jgi:lathosterol oxidase
LTAREVARPEFVLGEGKLSGILSAALGALGFGAVLVLLFPSWLSTPDLRELYPMGLVRGGIQLALVAAFVLGATSLILSRRRVLPGIGIVLALAATLLGGAQVEIETPVRETPWVALDWFLLSLLLLAGIFIPLERLFARDPEQHVFRAGWRTDLVHFGVSHLLVQVTVLLTMLPAALFFHWLVNPSFQARVASQPLVLQFLEAMFVADLFAYAAHRLFHEVPVLWRFHAVHHSSQRMDWLASSRLHVVDIVVTRAFGFVPLYVLGFEHAAIYAYLVWASFQGILVHCNLRFDFGPLRYVFVTPRFHCWHHSAVEPLDRNLAAHLPVIDWIFGSYYLPKGEWPEACGIEGNPLPENYLGQLLHPFAPDRSDSRT